MSVTGAVSVDLTVEPDLLSSRDRQKLAVLDTVRSGGRVIVDIGDRQYITHDVATMLHRHRLRLGITIIGARPEAVDAFVEAVSLGADWSAA